MVIFYGFKTFTKEVLKRDGQTCVTCGTKTSVSLFRERRWFELFWIPIFPVSTKYYHLCDSCNSRTTVTNADAKAELKEAK